MKGKWAVLYIAARSSSALAVGMHYCNSDWRKKQFYRASGAVDAR
jgi:hypothetical protein